jgi:hypothetical protein
VDPAATLRHAVALTRAAGTARVRVLAADARGQEQSAWSGACDLRLRAARLTDTSQVAGPGTQFLIVDGASYMGLPAQGGERRWVAVPPGMVFDPFPHLEGLESAASVVLGPGGSDTSFRVGLGGARRVLRRRRRAHVSLDEARRVRAIRYPRRRGALEVVFDDYGVDVPAMSPPARTVALSAVARSSLRRLLRT